MASLEGDPYDWGSIFAAISTLENVIESHRRNQVTDNDDDPKDKDGNKDFDTNIFYHFMPPS